MQNKNRCIVFSNNEHHYGIIDQGKHSFYQLENLSIASTDADKFLWSYTHRTTKTKGYFLNLDQLFTHKETHFEYDDQVLFFKNIKHFGILTKLKKANQHFVYDVNSIKNNSQTQQLSLENTDCEAFTELLINFQQSFYLIDPIKAYHYFSNKYEW